MKQNKMSLKLHQTWKQSKYSYALVQIIVNNVYSEKWPPLAEHKIINSVDKVSRAPWKLGQTLIVLGENLEWNMK